MNILKNKVTKNCMIPLEVVHNQSSMNDLMTRLVQLSKQVPLADPIRRKQILLCNASCLCLFLKSLQHHAVNSKNTAKDLEVARTLITDTIGNALEDFLEKRSHLSQAFFETMFSRYPLLCVTFVPMLQKQIIEGNSNNYKRLELVSLLTCLIQNARSAVFTMTVPALLNYKNQLSLVKTWAQDKLENREKEGYEDFRKQPRRKTLNAYCKAYETLISTPVDKTTKTRPHKEGKTEKKRTIQSKEGKKNSGNGKKGLLNGEKKERTAKKEKAS